MIQGLFSDVLAGRAGAGLSALNAGIGASGYIGQGGEIKIPGAPQGGGVDWSKQPGVMANVDWSTLKPFQVMPQSFVGSPYQQIPMNAEEAKAKLDSTPTTDTRSEYQKWLDSQGQQRGEGGRDRTGGTAGNGTNLSDQDWASVKAMRDEQGWGNPFDTAGFNNLKNLATNPSSLFRDVLQGNNPQMDALRNFQAQQVAYSQQGQDQRAAEAAAMAQQAAPSGLRSAPVGLSPDQMSAAQQAAMVADMTRAERGGGDRASAPSTSHQTQSAGYGKSDY